MSRVAVVECPRGHGAETVSVPADPSTEIRCRKCGDRMGSVVPQTFAVGDIAAFARQVEIAAGDQGALWHEGV